MSAHYVLGALLNDLGDFLKRLLQIFLFQKLTHQVSNLHIIEIREREVGIPFDSHFRQMRQTIFTIGAKKDLVNMFSVFCQTTRRLSRP